ncbi:MAG TPA: hypothetical protein QGF58_25055 [Myxococcota bacterium]|nr:hypothetical protein [Myxococcota bacterium]
MLLLLSSAFAARGALEQESVTSPREKMVFAATAISEMREVRDELEDWNSNSRGPRRVCLDKQLRTLDHLIEASEEASMAIPDALAEGAAEVAELEFRKVTVALGRTREVRDIASVCGTEPITVGPEIPAAWKAGWTGVQE